jgi:ABC-type multidrug transport system permease subunit
MLHVLLAKDLRRAWRNPLPWLINLAVPLCITALIGLAFGGKSNDDTLGRIRFAVVDEDDSILTQFLRGSTQQGEGAKRLEPVFMTREAAMRQILDNQLAAVVIIPANFTRGYLTGSQRVSLELIKNPAQSIHPAVLEELLGAAVTGLNAIARNFQSEFPDWQAVIEGRGDYRKVSQLIERAGDKLQAAKTYVNPPLVTYTKVAREKKPADPQGPRGVGPSRPPKKDTDFNLFAYLLAGLCAMFLLFSASSAMSDLHRESEQHTFTRYHTLQQALMPFVAGKVVLAIVLLMISSAVMLGGGSLVFGIRWHQPLALMLLVLVYAGFAAGFMAVLTAVVTNRRAGDVLSNIAGMALGLAGGCAFPPQQLPAFLREQISPLLPTYWFAEAVRRMELGNTEVPWLWVALRLASLGLLLIAIAAFLFRRRFRKGLHA